MAKVNCPNCGLEYSKGGLWSRYDEELCPDCHFDSIEDKHEITELGKSDVSNSVRIPAIPRDTHLNGDMSKLIDAQNRTTHAVRSIAIIIVASPIVYIGVLAFWTLSTVNRSTAGQIVAGAVGLVAGVYLVVLSLAELVKSKIN